MLQKENCGQNYKRWSRKGSSSILFDLSGSPKDTDFKWPYNLIKFMWFLLLETSHYFIPKDPAAKTGFDLFNKTASAVMPSIK
jgi:hypothetical protein